MAMERGYRITTDSSEIDHRAVWQWLHDSSYWAEGRPWELHERATAGSVCFGALAADGTTAGFARVVTDGVLFAWLADVCVLPAHRGRGLGKALVEAVVDHPDFVSIKRIMLATEDAHALYEQFDFGPMRRPERYMERFRS